MDHVRETDAPKKKTEKSPSKKTRGKETVLARIGKSKEKRGLHFRKKEKRESSHRKWDQGGAFLKKKPH